MTPRFRTAAACLVLVLVLGMMALTGCSKQPATGPGSADWKAQTKAYVVVLSRANQSAVKSLTDQAEALRSGSTITSAQAGYLMSGASEDLAKTLSELNAAKPPAELDSAHKAEIAFVTLGKLGVEKQAAGVKAKDASLIAEGQALLKQAEAQQQKAQAALKAFLANYGGQLQ